MAEAAIGREESGPKYGGPGITELSLARIARFYATNPLTLPGWFLEVLEMSIPALRAEEQLSAAVSGRIAGATEKSWTRAVRDLQRTAQPYEPIPPVLVAAKYADWFEREGIPHVAIEGVH